MPRGVKRWRPQSQPGPDSEIEKNEQTKLFRGPTVTSLDAKDEAKLTAAGLRLVEGPMIATPPWASKWHRLSFNKVAALSFMQFEQVIVLDNDAGLLQNIDHLAHAPTPSAIFHTTIGPLAKRTHCAVTTGVLVLRPAVTAYQRALTLLASMSYTKEEYDGGDEEFWLRYFNESSEPLHELPWRYHAHRMLPLPASAWEDVRMMHLIETFAGRSWHIPKNLTRRVEKYFGASSKQQHLPRQIEIETAGRGAARL